MASMSGNILRSIVLMLFLSQSFSTAFAQGGEEIEKIRDYIVLSRSFIGVNNQKAHELAIKALESAQLAGIDSLKAKSHRFIGIASYYLSDFNQSLIHYDSALFYYSKLKDTLEQARIHNNKGAVYNQLDLFQKAVEEYIKARDMYQILNNMRGIIILQNNIGSLYQYLREYETALYYYQKARELAQAHGYKEELISALGNIATIYELEQRTADAKEAYRNAINQAGRAGSNYLTASLHTNYGSFWVEQQQPDSALRYFSMARDLYGNMNLNLAKLYLGMARAYKMKMQGDKAYNYYKLALDNVSKGNDAVLRMRILKELAELHARKGDYTGAYGMLSEFAEEAQMFRNDNDSLKNKILQLHFKINKLESTADSLSGVVAEIHQLNSGLKAKNGFLSFLFVFSIAILIIIASFLLYILKLNRQQKIVIGQKNLEHNQLITENNALRESKSELLNVKSLLNRLAEATTNPLGIKNGNNEWLVANDAMCKVMGVRSGQLNGCDAARLAASTQRSGAFLRMLEVAEEIAWMKGEVVKLKETLNDVEGENLGDFSVIRVPVVEADGARKYIIIYLVPINQGVKDDRSAEITSISNSLSVLSHEIRTPLNAVIGFSDMLASEDLEPVKRRQYSRIIQRNGNILLKLIDDLLTFTSLESGKLEIHAEAFDFRELFVSLHTRLINKALELGKHHLEVRIRIPDSPCIIIGDDVRWHQILDNLADNAIRFTQKGHVTIGYSIENKVDGRLINAFVEDTGPGIPDAMQAKVFDPFIRFSEQQGQMTGAGLGLSIVRLLVDKMNIRLSLHSEPGKGTRIELMFEEKAQVDSNVIQKETLLQYTGKLAGKKILIVEDVESNTELLRIILQGAGATVYHAETGEGALQTCLNDESIDLVIMDIQLPKMNGLEATRQIKSFRPKLLVIAHTAYAMANEKEACFEAGCDGYVAKPIKPRLLLPILEQLFEK